MGKDKRTFIYQIPPLIPPKKDLNSCLGIWGFSTELNPDFAKIARGTKLTKEFNDRMQENGKDIIKKYFDIENTEEIYSPYTFLEESFLLHYVQVPGDGCDLGLSSSNDVAYSSHNIDSREQAYCLLSLWIDWANGAKIVLKY